MPGRCPRAPGAGRAVPHGRAAVRPRTRSDGSFAVERCPFRSLVLRAGDYLALFAESGLAPQAFADYTDRAADGTEKITCFVCEARA